MVDKSIGERIKNRRVELGLLQTELAELVGFKSGSAITLIENGDRSLKQDKIKPMCQALHVSLSWLMGWDEEEELVKQFTNMPLKDKEYLGEFMNLMSQLTDKNKEEVVRYMKYLLFDGKE